MYNLGIGISVQKNRMEYNIVYDVVLAKKYVSHQGALKVRINF